MDTFLEYLELIFWIIFVGGLFLSWLGEPDNDKTREKFPKSHWNE